MSMFSNPIYVGLIYTVVVIIVLLLVREAKDSTRLLIKRGIYLTIANIFVTIVIFYQNNIEMICTHPRKEPGVGGSGDGTIKPIIKWDQELNEVSEKRDSKDVYGYLFG